MADTWRSLVNYLLYNASCADCADIAKLTENVCAGWLEIRSLTDLPTREMLDRHAPGWKWRPMLVTCRKQRIHVWWGVGMAIRIFLGIGPVRAFRLLTAAV